MEKSAGGDRDMFRLDPQANLNGTSQLTTIRVGPRALIDAFGEPDAGSADDKVSGQYRFSGPDNSVFAVYDYKKTARWNRRYPAPEVFWRSMTPTEFSIGGRGSLHVDAFKAWLLRQIHHLKTE